MPCLPGEGGEAPGTPHAGEGEGEAATDRGGGPGKTVSINLDAKTWAKVVEAAKIVGKEPGQWARDALVNAASQQAHKALQRQRAKAAK